MDLNGHELPQAGHTTGEISMSRARSGRRRVKFEYRRPGRAWARDLKIFRARPGARLPERGLPGAQARCARPGLAPPGRVGPTRKDPWINNTSKYRIFFTVKTSQNAT